MDAVDLLGKVLQNKTLTSAIGKQVLGGLLGGGQQQSAPAPGGGLLGQILTGAIGGGSGQPRQSNPMMEAVLDGVLKKVTGRQGGSAQQGGGIGDLLGNVLGGSQAAPRQAPQPQQGGGIGDLLGSVLGGGQAAPRQAPQPRQGGGIGDLLGSVLGGGGGQSHAAPTRPSMQQMDPNACAALMIRAMVNAAKSDGRLDDREQQSILQKFGQLGEAELEFLRREFAAPLDVACFTSSIPSGLEQQIYAISVTAVEVDQQKEANYLGKLAQGLNLDPRWCNQVHDQLGAPRIFG